MIGLICAEGSLWKDQRQLTIDCLRRLGMKNGSSRLMERMETGVQEFIDVS